MKKYFVLMAGLLLIGFTENSNSKSFRVNQIPNGSKNSCTNCHVSSTNDTRNAFGKTIENSFLSGGNVVWGPELAKIDSDGDGYTNGEELQDPNGTWKIGAGAIGDVTKVTNPGVKTSVPTGVLDDIMNMDFSLSVPTPNPFFQSATIQYNLNVDGLVFIAIYDINGGLVKNLLFENLSSGQKQITWDGTNNEGYTVNTGKYFVYVSMNGKTLNKAIELVK
eukprot:TRINITY_DN17400_c0_g1_i1.p1 TRINITY_DN17400_c0_g1~~TRINITY_DN17400_c0_g1_i1.p1  ORF type:complete len:221 (-),score=-14.31 TRINITY_DN17400_c0_g1_i1:990-1652(-)